MSRAAIIIPARYHSTRLPGKPLIEIAGQTMLSRVVALARDAAAVCSNVQVAVTTDDVRIAEHCNELSVDCLMTDPDCPSGTDRVAAACAKLAERPEYVINMQGDAPLTPPQFIVAIIDALRESQTDIATPVTRLSWEALDQLRHDKQSTPFSGTCAVFDPQTHRAHWFSKQVIPAIRKENDLRNQTPDSPVYRHIGMYGYRYDALLRYTDLPESNYETLEGLEQLRALEAGMSITCVPVEYGSAPAMSGVDSPEDVVRAESLLAALEQQ